MGKKDLSGAGFSPSEGLEKVCDAGLRAGGTGLLLSLPGNSHLPSGAIYIRFCGIAGHTSGLEWSDSVPDNFVLVL